MLSKLTDINSKIQNNEILYKGFSGFLLKIIGLVCGYGFMLYVTNIMGASVWGQFSLALMMLSFASILGKFGLDSVLLKYVSAYRNNNTKIMIVYKRAIRLVVISSLIISAVLFFGSELISRYIFDNLHFSSIFKIVAVVVIPFSVFQVNTQFIRGLKRIKESIFLNDILKFIFAVIILFFMSFYTLNDYDPVIAFASSIIVLMLLSTYYIFRYKKEKNEGTLDIKTPNFRQLISESFPMMFSTSFLVVMPGLMF